MSQENVELVRRLVDAFNRQDADAVRGLWRADGEWRPAYFAGGLVEGSVFSGIDRIVEFLELQAETWVGVGLETLDTRDGGDWVLVETRLSATGRTSGIPVERVTWNVYELAEGRIATGRAYTTEQEALEAVGLEG